MLIAKLLSSFIVLLLMVSPASTASLPDSATAARVLKGYGKLPFSFEANQGQADSRVKFLSRGNGYTLFLTSNEAVLSLRKPGTSEARKESRRLDKAWEVRETKAETLEEPGVVIRMKLIGANPSPHVAGEEELPGKANYFIGNDPKNWRTNVPSYAKVRYKDVYSGIDLVYYGKQRQLEYDFVVACVARTWRLSRVRVLGLHSGAASRLLSHSWS